MPQGTIKFRWPKIAPPFLKSHSWSLVEFSQYSLIIGTVIWCINERVKRAVSAPHFFSTTDSEQLTYSRNELQGEMESVKCLLKWGCVTLLTNRLGLRCDCWPQFLAVVLEVAHCYNSWHIVYSRHCMSSDRTSVSRTLQKRHFRLIDLVSEEGFMITHHSEEALRDTTPSRLAEVRERVWGNAPSDPESYTFWCSSGYISCPRTVACNRK